MKPKEPDEPVPDAELPALLAKIFDAELKRREITGYALMNASDASRNAIYRVLEGKEENMPKFLTILRMLRTLDLGLAWLEGQGVR